MAGGSTWKQAASTRPKAATATQAAQPEGCLLPRAAAKATSSAPAGRRRSAATKKGPVLGMTPFIATMAVPQKKKGDTSDAHSHHSLPTSAARADAVDRVHRVRRRVAARGMSHATAAAREDRGGSARPATGRREWREDEHVEGRGCGGPHLARRCAPHRRRGGRRAVGVRRAPRRRRETAARGERGSGGG
ncbi:Os10g0493850, partial [Oryza sativa Japonica Group]